LVRGKQSLEIVLTTSLILHVFIYIDFGYDISDYEAVQPEYGTMEDFEELIVKAKELGKERTQRELSVST
jgi:glycosidase